MSMLKEVNAVFGNGGISRYRVNAKAALLPGDRDAGQGWISTAARV